MWRRMLLLGGLCLLLTPVWAGSPLVWEVEAKKPFDAAYDGVYQALEARKFFVIFEPNIGQNISRMAERWGDDYNRNGLEGIRAMAVCNPWYTNQISNKDPAMLGLCPLHLSLYFKDGVTHVTMLRFGKAAGDSPAAELLAEIESEMQAAVREGLGLGHP